MEFMLFLFYLSLVFILLSLYPSALDGLNQLLKDLITAVVILIAKIIISIRRVITWIKNLF